MSNLLLNYLFFLCIAGFVILSILSMMAYANLPCMKIKDGNNIKSGTILILTAILYALISLGIYFKLRRNEEFKKNMIQLNDVANKKEYVRMINLNSEEDSLKKQ